MAKSVAPIYTMPLCNNKYVSGSELQYTLDNLCNEYFLDILNNSLCLRVSRLISPSSSKCVLCVKYLV